MQKAELYILIDLLFKLLLEKMDDLLYLIANAPMFGELDPELLLQKKQIILYNKSIISELLTRQYLFSLNETELLRLINSLKDSIEILQSLCDNLKPPVIDNIDNKTIPNLIYK